MKKAIFLILLMPLGSLAQKISLCPFYNMSSAMYPSTFSVGNDHTTVTVDTSITDYTYESFQISLGQGSRFGISTEYKWKKLINLGASLSYFKSKDHPIVYSSSSEYDPYTIYNIKFTNTEIYRNKSLDLNLYSHLLFTEKNTTPYVNAGVVLSFSKYTLNREVYIQNNLPGYYPTERYIYDYTLSPSFHYGLTGAIGIDFNRNGVFSLFVEANAQFMNVSPKSMICTAKTWNSEDRFDAMTISEKEFEYVETYADSDNQSDNEPTKALKYNQSFSSIGIRGGIKINL